MFLEFFHHACENETGTVTLDARENIGESSIYLRPNMPE